MALAQQELTMFRQLRLTAVCACIIASVGCEGATSPGPIPKATVEFSGRVINADTDAPVGNVRVSVERYSIHPQGWAGPVPTNTVTSTDDGTFTSHSLSRLLGRKSLSNCPVLDTTRDSGGSSRTRQEPVRRS